jgi:hypothetical protein
MWQIYEGKVIALTRGGLTSRWKQSMKSAATANCEKSAKAIVPVFREVPNGSKSELSWR